MPARMLWLLLGGAVVLIVLSSLLTGELGIFLASIVLVGAIALGVALIGFVRRNQKDSRDPATDRDNAVPMTPMSPGGDDRPLGDTPEAHDELDPHDLPPSHPGRPAAERQAREQDGATRGNPEGGAASPDERIGERR